MQAYDINVADHRISVYYDWHDDVWWMVDDCATDPGESWARMCHTRSQAERYARIAKDILEEEHAANNRWQ
jgi:hypothetical protein